MGKLIFFLLLGFIAWLLVKGLVRGRLRHDDPEARAARVEDMVACARCGVNMPRSEAREEAGKFYCLNNPQCRP